MIDTRYAYDGTDLINELLMELNLKEKCIPHYILTIDGHRPVLKQVEEDLCVGYNQGGLNEVLWNVMHSLELHKQFTEHLYVLMLNNQNHFIGFSELSHGSQKETPVPIRELLITLLLSGATKFYLIHNHPDAPARLSTNDFNAVGFLNLALTNLDIELVDSIIISSDGNWTSYKKETEPQEEDEELEDEYEDENEEGEWI